MPKIKPNKKVPTRTVRIWQLRELWGGAKGTTSFEGVAEYRANISVWGKKKLIADIFFHDPEELASHPTDSINSQGWILF